MRVHTKSSVYLKYLPDVLLFSACGFLSWLNPRLQLHLFYCMLSINMDLSYGVNVFVPVFRFLLFVFLAAEKCCRQKVAVVITSVTFKSRRSNTARNKNKVAFIVSFIKRK